MSFIAGVLLGFAAGVAACVITPPEEGRGKAAPLLLGTAGGAFGSIIAARLGFGVLYFDILSLIVSLVVAIFFLAFYRVLNGGTPCWRDWSEVNSQEPREQRFLPSPISQTLASCNGKLNSSILICNDIWEKCKGELNHFIPGQEAAPLDEDGIDDGEAAPNEVERPDWSVKEDGARVNDAEQDTSCTEPVHCLRSDPPARGPSPPPCVIGSESFTDTHSGAAC